MEASANWSELTDANGESYDPSQALAAIETGDLKDAYDELWEKVHHQGDLGTAAYAIVPRLVRVMVQAEQPDWRAYALIATVEERRRAEGNPPVPEWLTESYRDALEGIVEPALRHLGKADNDLDVRSIVAAVAHAKGQWSIGALALWTEDERLEILKDQ